MVTKIILKFNRLIGTLFIIMCLLLVSSCQKAELSEAQEIVESSENDIYKTTKEIIDIDRGKKAFLSISSNDKNLIESLGDIRLLSQKETLEILAKESIDINFDDITMKLNEQSLTTEIKKSESYLDIEVLANNFEIGQAYSISIDEIPDYLRNNTVLRVKGNEKQMKVVVSGGTIDGRILISYCSSPSNYLYSAYYSYGPWGTYNFTSSIGNSTGRMGFEFVDYIGTHSVKVTFPNQSNCPSQNQVNCRQSEYSNRYNISRDVLNKLTKSIVKNLLIDNRQISYSLFKNKSELEKILDPESRNNVSLYNSLENVANKLSYIINTTFLTDVPAYLDKDDITVINQFLDELSFAIEDQQFKKQLLVLKKHVNSLEGKEFKESLESLKKVNLDLY